MITTLSSNRTMACITEIILYTLDRKSATKLFVSQDVLKQISNCRL